MSDMRDQPALQYSVTVDRALSDIRYWAKFHDVLPACIEPVLEDAQFLLCPGSVDKHHAFAHGLLIHTYEVAYLARQASFGYPAARVAELLVAAIWHDYGKIQDYQFADSEEDYKQEEVYKLPTAELIRHVANSYAAWDRHARAMGMSTATRELVGHLILSHHGRREWGSPVEPTCCESLILAQADYQSAKCPMFDSRGVPVSVLDLKLRGT